VIRRKQMLTVALPLAVTLGGALLGHWPAALLDRFPLRLASITLAPRDENASLLLRAAVSRNAPDRRAVGSRRKCAPLPHPAPRSASEEALREAKRCWSQAVLAVKPTLEALSAERPDAPPGLEEACRRRLMTCDRTGDLSRASVAARQAASRAKTPEERYEAEVWLALIECDRGHHRTELQHAQRLVRLQPGNSMSWGALRRAARCNGHERLARRADVRLTLGCDTPPR
jgi:hypothetical protein